MLLKIALLLLVVWVLGIVVYDARPLIHVLLLVGLMLLLLAFVKAREAALRDPAGGPPETR
jgi:hypothetical protein